MRGLAGRIRLQRSKVIASPGFQRWAARLPLVRSISAKKARNLFNLAAGFVYSQILFTLVESEIFGFLEEGPRSTQDIAGFCNMPAGNAERLMRAAAEIDLVSEINEQWYLSDLGAVVASNPGIRAMVQHHSMLYADLSDPLSLLRGEVSDTRINGFWKYAATDSPTSVIDVEAAAYSALMSASQDLVIQEVLSAYDFSSHRCVLDVGGGEGRFLKAVHNSHPGLALQLFDLPAVTGRARIETETTAGTGQIDVFSGDFFRDSLPSGADLMTLVRIVCDHDDGPALKLLTNIRSAMEPGAKVL
ncbi:MAG: methyltransferase, partial [Pseudomonadota bacterium]